MTELQRIRAHALTEIRRAKLWHEDSFVAHMKHIAEHNRTLFLSTRQNAYLEKLCWKYREQLRTNGYGHTVPAQCPFPESEPSDQAETEPETKL